MRRVAHTTMAAVPTAPLSPREWQVATLISQGRTNKQIAAELIITEWTVMRHVEHILNKLGMHARAEVAVWVATRREMELPHAKADVAASPAAQPRIGGQVGSHIQARSGATNPARQITNNLPLQLTSFIGRDQELQEIKHLLQETRLLTLTGAGGSGKTRLAYQVAADLLDRYPDGVWVAELASTTDPALVPAVVAEALRLPAEPGQSGTAALAAGITARRLLLVLDNCEHLLVACAHLAGTLLRGCPHLQILATSREALGVAGERAWPVPSLSLPAMEHLSSLLPPGEVLASEAVRLFVDRATAANPGFAITHENLSALVQICRRLDGIPLAIELAAARAKALVPEQIAGRLGDRFRLLTGGSRTALPRHQTLRALVDWSYDLLSNAERAVLRRLSVFAGGCTLEAAEAVCAGEPVGSWEVIDHLIQLVDKSLVLMEARPDGARYRLLETIRLYSRDRLLESGEAATLRDRHRDWCLAFVRNIAFGGPRRFQLIPEQDNLRTALDWCLETAPLAGLELATAAANLWQWQGRHIEAIHWLEVYLARVPADFAGHGDQSVALARATLRAQALTWLGRLLRELGEIERASAPQAESLTLFQQIGDERGAAFILEELSLIARADGRPQAALRLFEEALTVYRRVGHTGDESRVQRNLGLLWFSIGDLPRAKAAWEESITLARRSASRLEGIAVLLTRLGVIARLEGDLLRSRQLLEEALTSHRQGGFRWGIYVGIAALGDLEATEGNVGQAREHYRQIILEAREHGFDVGWQHGLVGLGLLAGDSGDHHRAARLLGALAPADITRMVMHAPYCVAPTEAALTTCRAVLGDAAFEALCREARSMSLLTLAVYALEETSAPGSQQEHVSPISEAA
jgi:predicted ATPase/DNA-binding CsgD family transcriptional regulator